MMISTKGRYALRMLVDMAEHERGNTYVPLKEIAARQEISEKYLESIVKLLVQNNVLIGVRGKGGGYRLNGTPDQFTVRIEKHRLCNTTIGTFRSPVTQIAKFRRTVHPYPVRIGKRHFSNPVEHHGIPEIRRIRSFEYPLYHQIQQQAIHSRPGIFFHQMHLLYSFVPTTDGFHFMISNSTGREAFAHWYPP